MYGLFLRDDRQSDLVYGTSRYDYDAGTLICVAPGQVGGAEERGQGGDIRGWALLFASDFIRGTHLEGQMQQFHFFSYSSNWRLREWPGTLGMKRQTALKLAVNYVDAICQSDMPAWNPNLRSKSAIRTSGTRYFVDPSIAASAWA